MSALGLHSCLIGNVIICSQEWIYMQPTAGCWMSFKWAITPTRSFLLTCGCQQDGCAAQWKKSWAVPLMPGSRCHNSLPYSWPIESRFHPIDLNWEVNWPIITELNLFWWKCTVTPAGLCQSAQKSVRPHFHVPYLHCPASKEYWASLPESASVSLQVWNAQTKTIRAKDFEESSLKLIASLVLIDGCCLLRQKMMGLLLLNHWRRQLPEKSI